MRSFRQDYELYGRKVPGKMNNRGNALVLTTAGGGDGGGGGGGSQPLGDGSGESICALNRLICSPDRQWDNLQVPLMARSAVQYVLPFAYLPCTVLV